MPPGSRKIKLDVKKLVSLSKNELYLWSGIGQDQRLRLVVSDSACVAFNVAVDASF